MLPKHIEETLENIIRVVNKQEEYIASLEERITTLEKKSTTNSRRTVKSS